MSLSQILRRFARHGGQFEFVSEGIIRLSWQDSPVMTIYRSFGGPLFGAEFWLECNGKGDYYSLAEVKEYIGYAIEAIRKAQHEAANAPEYVAETIG